jgi:23S rRNA pseudouridine955/2504/2580 synthase
VSPIIDRPPFPLSSILSLSPAVRYLQIEEENEGQRLDNFLIRELQGAPKSHIYQLIRSGQVRVNKGRCSADRRLSPGDLVRLPPVRLSRPPTNQPTTASTIHQPRSPSQASHGGTLSLVRRAINWPELPVLFEDEHLLAIHKPAGLAVHGGSGIAQGVIEQLRIQRPQARFLELVHRLDKETSGILLVAKKRSSLLALQDQLRHHQMQKHYLAVALGTWPPACQRIDLPLRKYLLPHGERRVRVVSTQDPLGKPAITHIRRKAVWQEASSSSLSLLEVSIQTGRTHQIRVHLASQGHPVAGDEKYTPREEYDVWKTRGLSRMLLHAQRLRLSHPQTQTLMTIVAELPSDWQAFCASRFQYGG